MDFSVGVGFISLQLRLRRLDRDRLRQLADLQFDVEAGHGTFGLTSKSLKADCLETLTTDL